VVGMTLALSGCGDDKDDIFRGIEGSSSSRLTGIYFGSLEDENFGRRSVLDAIDKSSHFWLLYSPPAASGYAGLMSGRFSLSGNTLNANDIRDYNFALNRSASAVFSGIYTTDKNLQGNVNNAANQRFNLNYNAALSRGNNGISSITGHYTGLTTTLLNQVNTTINIESSGRITGTVGELEKCAFAGQVNVENNAPYYNVHLLFTGTDCLNGRQEVDGILLNQIENQ